MQDNLPGFLICHENPPSSCFDYWTSRMVSYMTCFRYHLNRIPCYFLCNCVKISVGSFSADCCSFSVRIFLVVNLCCQNRCNRKLCCLMMNSMWLKCQECLHCSIKNQETILNPRNLVWSYSFLCLFARLTRCWQLTHLGKCCHGVEW